VPAGAGKKVSVGAGHVAETDQAAAGDEVVGVLGGVAFGQQAALVAGRRAGPEPEGFRGGGAGEAQRERGGERAVHGEARPRPAAGGKSGIARHRLGGLTPGMRTNLFFIPVAAALLVTGCATPSPTPAGGAATVHFDAPERFTDFSRSGDTQPDMLASLMAELERGVARAGERHVPAGQALELMITDVDMAGIVRRGPPRSLRVVDSNQSARVDLAYRLTDRTGAVLREGRETLVRRPSDLGVSSRFSDDRLALLDSAIANWMEGLDL